MLANSTSGKDFGTIEFREILIFFLENFGKILLGGALGLGIAWLYVTNVRPTYASTATIEVNPNTRAQGVDDDDSADVLKTIELEITNPSVLLAAVRARHLNRDADFAPDRTIPEIEAVIRLRKSLAVEIQRGSRLIAVTAEAHDPLKARDLAQTILDEFFHQSLAAHQRDSAGSRDLLLAEVRRVGNELRLSEERLEAYREEHNAVSLEDRQNVVVDRLRDLNQRVAAAKNTRLALEAERDEARRLAAADPEQALSLNSIASAPEVIDLRRQVALAGANVATLSQRYGPLHPTLIQAKSELANLRSSLAQAVRRAAARIEQSFAAAKATENALASALAEQEKTALALDRTAIPYRTLERDVQANATMYQKILDEVRQMDDSHRLMTANEVDGTQIRIVAPPLTPTRPARPRSHLIMAAGTLGGFIVGCAGVLSRRAMDNTFGSVDATESALALPVLVTIPRSRSRRLNARPEVVRHPASDQSEAFRSLRTALSLVGEGEEFRTVLFTSALPGEGKSHCSLNFAAALAQQGYKTLLIDADLRRPSIQRLFPVPTGQRATLTDCLKDPGRFAAAVHPTPIERLSRIGDWQGRTAGPELLGTGQNMRRVLELAIAKYDRVVVDTPPILAVGDALRLAREVEAVCLVIDASRTPRRAAQRACKLLDEVARRRPTGVVLNRIGRKGAARQYYHYEYAYGAKA